VPYVSATIPSLDGVRGDNRGRIVVSIQDNNTSHYVQFTVSADNTTGPFRQQASVVKVRKTGTATGTYIFDWQRTDNDEFAYRDRAGSLFGNDQHCYTCHWSGVLAIHPFQPSTDIVGADPPALGSQYAEWLVPLNAKYAAETTKLNSQIKKDTQTPDWRKIVQSPFLNGFPNLFLNPSESCSADQKTAMSQLKADNCNSSNCHQNRGKAIFELGNYGAMIDKYVAGGLMPPSNNRASLVTRESASQCFQTDAALKMTAWLKGADCTQ
jgi:hypothetical protein